MISFFFLYNNYADHNKLYAIGNNKEEIDTAQKMKFSIKDLWSDPQGAADLVAFAEEILNGKLHFLCSVKEYLPKAFRQ